jgi:tRNA A-37 threonylcarbamoyl transferase component Bud32
MQRLEIHPDFASAFAELKLDSCAAAMQWFAEGQPPPKKSVMLLVKDLPRPGGSPVPVFYKQYQCKRPWKYLGRASKARREFSAYDQLRRLGIPTPSPVAWGELRDGLGRLHRSFIAITFVPDALTLDEFLAQRAGREHAAARESALRQLARMVRRIHDARFFHNDLYARNILVTDAPGKPALWWIDCPRGRFAASPIGRARRQIKDLAALDKSAGDLCRRRERIGFALQYLGKLRLDDKARALIRATLAYGAGRWRPKPRKENPKPVRA